MRVGKRGIEIEKEERDIRKDKSKMLRCIREKKEDKKTETKIEDLQKNNRENEKVASFSLLGVGIKMII